MFTIVTHCLYAGLTYYTLKAFEAYQAQINTGLVMKKDALRKALLWPKFLLK